MEGKDLIVLLPSTAVWVCVCVNWAWWF